MPEWCGHLLGIKLIRPWISRLHTTTNPHRCGCYGNTWNMVLSVRVTEKSHSRKLYVWTKIQKETPANEHPSHSAKPQQRVAPRMNAVCLSVVSVHPALQSVTPEFNSVISELWLFHITVLESSSATFTSKYQHTFASQAPYQLNDPVNGLTWSEFHCMCVYILGRRPPRPHISRGTESSNLLCVKLFVLIQLMMSTNC